MVSRCSRFVTTVSSHLLIVAKMRVEAACTFRSPSRNGLTLTNPWPVARSYSDKTHSGRASRGSDCENFGSFVRHHVPRRAITTLRGRDVPNGAGHPGPHFMTGLSLMTKKAASHHANERPRREPYQTCAPCFRADWVTISDGSPCLRGKWPGTRTYNTECHMTDGDRSGEDGELRQFLARIRDGDEDAARELLCRYEAKVRLVVRRLLPRLLRSRFDSQDFVQSIWGSFFRRIKTSPTELENTENLVGFLARAARNKVIDEYRRASSRKQDMRREESMWEGAKPRDLVAGSETASRSC